MANDSILHLENAGRLKYSDVANLPQSGETETAVARLTLAHTKPVLGPKENRMPQTSFYQYFKQNMNALGLPAPDSMFGTLGTATGTITALANLVAKFGTNVTVMEVLRAAPSLAVGTSEIGAVAGAMLATYYLGACIGSLAVATGQATSGGYSISDLFAAADKMGIQRASWMHDTFQHQSQSRLAGRRMSA